MTTTTGKYVDFDRDYKNITPQSFVEAPYEVFDMIRRKDPVLWVDQMGGRWMVTGLAEAHEVMLRHDKYSSDRRLWEHWEFGDQPAPGFLMVMDPPEHSRLRGLVQNAFTPRELERLRPRINTLVGEMLTEAGDRGEIDLVTDFAGPLPAIVMTEMLGVPTADAEIFKRFTMMTVAGLDTVSHTQKSPEAAARHRAERAKLEKYFDDLIVERRQRPSNDVISDLVQTEQHDDRLSGEELVQLCVTLTGAGLEPAAFLIGNAIAALFEFPDQLTRLRENPDMIETAFEEFLRYDGPINVGGRVVREDTELGGHQLRKGQLVGVYLGAANRDPRAFHEPNRLDIGRFPNPHVTFGHGIHHCLGAPVMRLVGPVAIKELVTRFPKLRPNGPARRLQNPHARGWESLPVALR